MYGQYLIPGIQRSSTAAKTAGKTWRACASPTQGQSANKCITQTCFSLSWLLKRSTPALPPHPESLGHPHTWPPYPRQLNRKHRCHLGNPPPYSVDSDRVQDNSRRVQITGWVIISPPPPRFKLRCSSSTNNERHGKFWFRTPGDAPSRGFKQILIMYLFKLHTKSTPTPTPTSLIKKKP